MDLLGFWSYVHADDNIDVGRIKQLAADITGHYEAQKAETIELFIDTDALGWGDKWRDRVDEALSNVAFFIPVLTPRFFQSAECRREFQFFLARAEKLGITQLILPILYIDVPELHDDDPTDPLMQTVQRIQWRDWLPYRFEDRESGEYRGAVHRLASELVQRVEAVERTDVVAAVEALEESIDEGADGTLDQMAALEEAMPRWAETLDEVKVEIERIGEIMTTGTEDVHRAEAQGKGFAARLSVARRLAGELDGPVAKMEQLSQDYAADLADIDAGVRLLLSTGVMQAKASSDPDDLKAICEFRNTVRELAMASREGLGAVEEMVAAVQEIEGMSRDLRQPLRRLRVSLTSMVEARDTTDEWLEVVETLDIDCGDQNVSSS